MGPVCHITSKLSTVSSIPFFVCGNTWICARDSQYICSWINIWLMIKNSLEIHIRGQYSSKQAIDGDILLRCFLQGWSNWHVLVVHKRLKSVTQSFLPRTRALESGHIIETKSRLNKSRVPLSVLPDTNLRCTSELSFHTKAIQCMTLQTNAVHWCYWI